MSDDQAGILAGCKERAFDMDVGVDKSGDNG
jgi:hypothetical protein